MDKFILQILYFKSESIEKEMNKEVCKVWNCYCCSTGKRGKKKWVGGGGGGGGKKEKKIEPPGIELGTFNLENLNLYQSPLLFRLILS